MNKFDSSSFINSDSQWLTEVAGGHSLKKIKFLAKIRNGEDQKAVLSDTGYSVYGSGGKFAYASAFLYDGESVLLGRKGTIDKPLYVNEKFWTVDTMFYTVPNQAVNAKFLYYATTTIPFDFYSTSTAIPSMTQFDLNNHKLAWPITYDEQTAIAKFLDIKSAKINEAIAIKQKQIELLKERKQIIIQQVVTQGLNPDTPMKNSGVDWIGCIPEHWNVKRLKYVMEERNERSKTGEEPLFMVSQVHGLVVRADYHEKAEVAASNIDSKIVYKNDLVFNKLKAHLGVFFKSNIDFKGLVSPDYAVYKSKAYISDMKILELLFRHPSYIEQFVIRATGIVEGLIRLYTSELFDIAVPIAPENEQREIISFVESESLKYDQAIAIQVQQIEKLKEYKTTLINSAVTGKIKVTEQA
ncbi:restriction endonuclease subunit S [Vibrio splendidus]